MASKLTVALAVTALVWLSTLSWRLAAPKGEPFVALAEDVVPKSTAMYVAGTAEWRLFDVTIATFPVVVRGAGVFVSPNNHVLTCAHLFTLVSISGITVCNSDSECTAGELLFMDVSRDLALVQANFDKPTNYARLADPRKLKVGQEVMAVGTPLGFPFSVTHGIISALNRNELGVYNMAQSDTFINPGNSGGPLFNLAGEIVGINSRIVPPINAPIFTGLGFSVESGQIVEFLTRWRQIDKAFPKYDFNYWNTFLHAIGVRKEN